MAYPLEEALAATDLAKTVNMTVNQLATEPGADILCQLAKIGFCLSESDLRS